MFRCQDICWLAITRWDTQGSDVVTSTCYNTRVFAYWDTELVTRYDALKFACWCTGMWRCWDTHGFQCWCCHSHMLRCWDTCSLKFWNTARSRCWGTGSFRCWVFCMINRDITGWAETFTCGDVTTSHWHVCLHTPDDDFNQIPNMDTDPFSGISAKRFTSAHTPSSVAKSGRCLWLPTRSASLPPRGCWAPIGAGQAYQGAKPQVWPSTNTGWDLGDKYPSFLTPQWLHTQSFFF